MVHVVLQLSAHNTDIPVLHVQPDNLSVLQSIISKMHFISRVHSSPAFRCRDRVVWMQFEEW
jgi:hypothetical protein